MLSAFRLAGILIVSLAVCGPVRAQEIAPAGSGVSIHKLVVAIEHDPDRFQWTSHFRHRG